MSTSRVRWRRRLLPAALALAAVLALGAAEWAGWPFLQGPAQRAATRAAGVPVHFDGRFALHLLGPPSLTLGRLEVGAAQGLPVGHLLRAEDVRLAWRWVDLWRWRQGAPLQVRALEAGTLDANLMRNADGRASWQLGTGDPDPGPGAPATARPSVGTLRVGAGLFRFIDEPTETRAVVTVQTGADGTMALTGVGTFRALRLDLQGHADSPLPLLQDDAEGTVAPPVRVALAGAVGRSTLSFTGSAASALRAQRVEGELSFSGPSLAAVGDPLHITLPRTPRFALQGHLAHDAGRWHLLARRFTVGGSQLAGDFTYDSTRTPGHLGGRLSGTRLRLADLGPAVGAAGEGTATAAALPAARPAGRVLPDRGFDLPSLRAMDAEVAVAIDELDLGSTAIAPLHGLRTQVRLAGGVLHLDALQAQLAGGTLSGTTSLDGRGDPARWAADLQLAQVDLAAGLPGVKGRVGGTLTADVHVTGQGRSTAQILGSLDGRARAALRKGQLSHLATEAAGLDLAQGLGVLLRGDQPLPLRCARLALAIHAGVATLQGAVLDNRDSSIEATGQVNLRDETLALKATVRPKDFSLLTLRTPLIVTGTLAQPQVGVEGSRVAGQVLAAVALGAVAGPAALLPFLDFGDAAGGADACAPKTK